MIIWKVKRIPSAAIMSWANGSRSIEEIRGRVFRGEGIWIGSWGLSRASHEAAAKDIPAWENSLKCYREPRKTWKILRQTWKSQRVMVA